MSDDAAETILTPVQADNSVKAAAWQAYKDSKDENDFAQRIRSLNLPQETKASLWEAKKGGGASAPAQTPETGIWAGVKRNTVGMVAGLYHAFSDPPTEQEKAALLQKVQEEKAWQAAHGYDPNDVDTSLATNPSKATLAYHRLLDAPSAYLRV